MILWHLLVHWTGSDYGSPGQFQPYDFLSGLAGLSVFSLLIAQLRKHNCHVHGCWRLGRHPVEGTLYTVCRWHHPCGHVTHDHVLDAHSAHLTRQKAMRETVAKLRKDRNDPV
jgi:hypothetical protein